MNCLRSALPLRRRLLCAWLAFCLAASGVAPLRAQGRPPTEVRLPSLGESASDEFNLSQEKRLGEQIMREIRSDPAYLDDPELLDYAQRIWQPLVEAARHRGNIGPDTERLFPYEIFLLRDPSVNAFALPGGYVGLHLGLMAITDTPDELASVLGHELSHITQRHIARNIAAASRSSSLGIAAMLLGLLVASRAGSVDGATAAVMGSQAAMAQSQLNFSRDMEREADRTGLAVMVDAGYAPVGMSVMFDKLDSANRFNDSSSFPYLRTHPLTVDRIGEARQYVEAHGAATKEPPPSLLHTMLQGRARVLMDVSVQALRRMQDLDARGAQTERPLAERVAALYAGALASSQLRDFARADRAIAAARSLLDGSSIQGVEPRRALSRLALQVALDRGDATAAKAALQAGAAGDDSRTSLMLQSEWALADGGDADLRRSAEALQTWVALHRGDASAWQLLSQIASRQGQQLRAVRAEAEAQAALGNLAGAVDRLRAGQQLARKSGANTDFIEASVIDARLRDLLALRQQLAKDER